MRRYACSLLTLLLCCAACGEGDAPSTAETFDPSIALPQAERFGAVPPREERLTVSISHLGAVRVNGEASSLKRLELDISVAVGIPVERRNLREPWRTPLRARMDGEVIEEELEEVEDDTEEVEEGEIVAEEPVIKDGEIADAPFEEQEGLSDVEDDGGPIDFRASDLKRNNPKRTVVELPARDPGPREIAPVDEMMTRPHDVLLVIDQRVPWRLVAEVAMICADPRLRLYRIFALVHGSPSPGAIAIFLPVDGGGCGGRMVVGTDVRVALRLRKRGRASLKLADVLPTFRERKPDALFVSLRAAELAPWGRVVDLMDQALAAGAYAFTFEGFPSLDGKHDCAAWIERAQGTGPYDVAVWGERPEEHAPTVPVAAGRREGYFGFSNAVTMGEPVLRDEEFEEIVEEPARK